MLHNAHTFYNQWGSCVTSEAQVSYCILVRDSALYSNQNRNIQASTDFNNMITLCLKSRMLKHHHHAFAVRLMRSDFQSAKCPLLSFSLQCKQRTYLLCIDPRFPICLPSERQTGKETPAWLRICQQFAQVPLLSRDEAGATRLAACAAFPTRPTRHALWALWLRLWSHHELHRSAAAQSRSAHPACHEAGVEAAAACAASQSPEECAPCKVFSVRTSSCIAWHIGVAWTGESCRVCLE